MKHTIEKLLGDHYRLNDEIDIKYIERLGNDNGWCIFNNDIPQEKIYEIFENALLTAMSLPINKPKVMTRPAGG